MCTAKTNLIRRQSQHKTDIERMREKGKLVDEMEEKFQLLRPTLIARSAYGPHIHKYRIYISIVCIVFVTVFLHFFLRVLTKASVRFLFFLSFFLLPKSSFDLQSLLVQEWNKNSGMIIELFVAKIKKNKKHIKQKEKLLLLEKSSKLFFNIC